MLQTCFICVNYLRNISSFIFMLSICAKFIWLFHYNSDCGAIWLPSRENDLHLFKLSFSRVSFQQSSANILRVNVRRSHCCTSNVNRTINKNLQTSCLSFCLSLHRAWPIMIMGYVISQIIFSLLVVFARFWDGLVKWEMEFS